MLIGEKIGAYFFILFYIQGINPYLIYSWQRFSSHSLSLYFTLAIISFTVQKFNSVGSHLSTFWVVSCATGERPGGFKKKKMLLFMPWPWMFSYWSFKVSSHICVFPSFFFLLMGESFACMRVRVSLACLMCAEARERRQIPCNCDSRHLGTSMWVPGVDPGVVCKSSKSV